jgi:hypothetical protein
MRSERAARDAAKALVTLPVPEVIVEVVNDERSSVMLDTDEVQFFSCCIDTVQRHHDMRWATMTKMIDNKELMMIDVKMKLTDSMVGNRLGDELRMSLMKMMDKIEKWNDELGLMMKEQRASNPIVGRVLKHAAHSMGSTVARNLTGNLKNATRILWLG